MQIGFRVAPPESRNVYLCDKIDTLGRNVVFPREYFEFLPAACMMRRFGTKKETTMSGQRLLLVDDDTGFRQVLAETFLDAGFQVVEAEDGDQAIGILEGLGQLDVLVTDIQMPGRFDGNDVATKAKNRHPGLAVVYVSGSPESVTNRIGPCDVFLGKPFHCARMLSEVRRLLCLAETLARPGYQRSGRLLNETRLFPAP
jgi:DNA-binding NtrC family response regulator